MNLRLIFILLLITPALVWAQTQTTYNKLEYYIGNYPGAGNVIRSAAAYDSTVILVVIGSDSLTYYKMQVVQTDMQGNKLHAVDFANDTIAWVPYPGSSIIIDSDSNIVIATNNWHTNTNFWDGVLVKLDKNLDTLWTKIISIPDSISGCTNVSNNHTIFMVIKETKNKNYIIGGRYFIDCLYQFSNERSFLLKVDKNGNIIWWRAYTNVRNVFDLDITSDSCFVFNDAFAGYYINKYDQNGNFIWKVKPNDLIHLLSRNIKTKDEYIISASPHRYDEVQGISIYGIDVTKLSLSGDIFWNKQYIPFRSFKTMDLHHHFQIEILPNDDILISGTGWVINEDSTKAGYKGIMLRLNSQGDSLWCRAYNIGDFSYDCQFNDLVLMDDGGFLAVGKHLPFYTGGIMAGWLVRTDSMGVAPGALTLDVKTLAHESLKFTVYPNPASDFVNIRLSELHNHTLVAGLYNALGQRLFYTPIDIMQQEIKIDVSSYDTGIYFLVLSDGSSIVGSVRLVVAR